MNTFNRSSWLTVVAVFGVFILFTQQSNAANESVNKPPPAGEDQEMIAEASGVISSLAADGEIKLAGIYVDGNNILHVGLTGKEEETMASREVIEEAIPAAVEVTFYEAHYQHTTLKQMQEAMRRHYGNHALDIVGTGIDVVNNTFYIEVDDLNKEKKTEIMERIPANLPKDAVEFRNVDTPGTEKESELAEFISLNPFISFSGAIVALIGTTLLIKRKNE